MSFPYHEVPDGSIAVPHHATWSLLLALIPILILWDNHPQREPVILLSGVLVSLIGFVLVWPTHHTLGAIVAVVASITATAAFAVRLAQSIASDNPIWGPVPLLVGLVLLLVALDDILQHAFGLSTPLDALWRGHLRPRLPSH